MAQTEPKPKIFNDSIHGYIEMHPLCVAIIDTEQFQRLRCIKQMGGAYYVYPGASHNRFEHSIGTSYLAGYFVESLKSKQKLEIDEKDVLCVKIAGLCHDLGHGPFSHMFDNDFIPKVRPEKEWSHEDASEEMFDRLIESSTNVQKKLKDYSLGVKDIHFIKKLMTGGTPKSKKEWKAVGRDENKRFLFEIVANKINGIDVDKWDYFARDCRYLGIKSSFDHMRCIQLARVIISNKDKDLPQICFRDSAVGNIYDLFHTRLSIHKKACQHKTVNAIEMMITEALEKANPNLMIEGKGGKKKTMSEAIDDMFAYTKLTDHVYYQILYSSDNKLKEAKEILQNIEERNLYKFIGYVIPRQDIPTQDGVPAMRKEIFEIVKKERSKLKLDDIIVQLTSFSYGGGKEDINPVDKVRFFAKDDEKKSLKINKDQVSRMLPKVFFEKEIRVYCKKRDQPTEDKMKKAFTKWCTHRGYQDRFYSYIERDIEPEEPAAKKSKRN